MHFHRTSRVLTSWVAILALLMAALAPSISQAWSARAGASPIEVCTATGAQWVQVDGSATDHAPGQGDARTDMHCPYCLHQAHAAAMPVTPVVVLPMPAHATWLPTAFLAAPRTLHAWRSASPRAPPPRA